MTLPVIPIGVVCDAIAYTGQNFAEQQHLTSSACLQHVQTSHVRNDVRADFPVKPER